ncbi:MAG: ATP-binding protein [Rhodothermales bacterium]|nr:ATP-binding protein [Rhodothermales bacterium]
MNLDELGRLVALGESATLEFKTRVPRPERIAKEVIALANSLGGRLLLGVDDDGSLRGVRDTEEEEYALREALDAYCEPAIAYSVERISINKKRHVLLVTIPLSASRPHYLIDPADKSLRAAYVRVEDMSVEASKERIRLMKARDNGDNVMFEFGDKEKVLMRYLENYGRITVSQFANLVNIPKKRASQTLVLMARANVLRLHTDPDTDYFTIAYDLKR